MRISQVLRSKELAFTCISVFGVVWYVFSCMPFFVRQVELGLTLDQLIQPYHLFNISILLIPASFAFSTSIFVPRLLRQLASLFLFGMFSYICIVAVLLCYLLIFDVKSF